MFAPAFRRPGVVVAIPRQLVLAHGDLPGKIPSGEYAARGSVPARAIVMVWYLIPIDVRWGRLELLVDAKTGQVHEGSRSSPGVRYAVIAAQEFVGDLCCT